MSTRPTKVRELLQYSVGFVQLAYWVLKLVSLIFNYLLGGMVDAKFHGANSTFGR